MSEAEFDCAYVERVIREIYLADIGDTDQLHWTTWSPRGPAIRLSVNCSDTFAYATADAETVEPEDLDRLIELMKEEDARITLTLRDKDVENINALLLWVCEKRCLRPLPQIWERLSDEMRSRLPYPPC